MDITIGQELHLDIRLETGETIVQVRIISLLGEGGFAKVWKVRDQATGKKYALKSLDLPALIAAGKLPEAKQEMLAERIRREASVQVNSPYVLRCLGLRELEQQAGFFLLFELFGEHDLKEWILENQLVRWEAKKALFLKILEGVQAIHQAGYVHRDLKPQNILVDERNIPKITDFGLVKAQASQHTQEWSFAGTFPYQDPYLIQAGGIKHADARSDVYALGVILYEMIVGTDPWTANELYHQAFVQGEIFNLIAGKQQILDIDQQFQFQDDASVRRMIEQCTTFDREQRTITLDEMIRQWGGRPASNAVSKESVKHDSRWLATLPEDLLEQVASEPPEASKPAKSAQPKLVAQPRPPEPKREPKSTVASPSSRKFVYLLVLIVLVIGVFAANSWLRKQRETPDSDASLPVAATPSPTATMTPEPTAMPTAMPTPEPTPTAATAAALQFDIGYFYQPLAEEDIVKPLNPGTVLHSGDCYQVQFTFNTLLRGQTTAYVYLFHSDRSGNAARLLRLNDFSDLQNPVQRGQTYMTRCFPVDATTGRHEIYLLASLYSETTLETATVMSQEELQRYTHIMEYVQVHMFEYQ